jgi:hypothetical protein
LELAAAAAGTGDDDEETGTTTSSHPVDLGGALIHGIDNNPIHSITTQMGIPLHTISDYCLLLDENGWPFDPKEDDKLSTLFNECLDISFQRAEQHKESSASFGDLFDTVCREKGVSPDNPLLKWHQANLELPTGAGFHDLGYTWNEDEPYGFAGDHAAVEPSWRLVMEHLATGLDILHNSPVTQIQIVLPDGSTPSSNDNDLPTTTATTTVSEPPQPAVSEATTKAIADQPLPTTRQPRSSFSTQTASPKPAASPTRSSRRLRGEDVNLRRSGRSNKGMIQLLQIGDSSSLCYNDPSKKHPRRNKRKRTTKEIEEEEQSSTVQVTLQNGTVLEANAVVCTLPLGVLKVPSGDDGHVRFVPSLPVAKRHAIEQLGCGLLNKCAMSFPNVFWQDSDFLGLADSHHSYLVLNAMKYTQKPILIFMYGGAFAKEVESWTDSDIVQDCLAVLKKICGKDVPAPVDYCMTRWGQEPYSRMAFTYIPPGVNGPKQLATIHEAIQDPVAPKKPLIMFAGEHTTPYHPSTMHGAFLSGIREAYRYDLYVEPALNDHMEFEADEKLYEHTFPTKRVYRNATAKKAKATNGSTLSPAQASAAAAAAHTANQIRSRRRRFAGMALRKLPKKILEKPPPKKNGPATTPDSFKSRRSQRSLSARKVERTVGNSLSDNKRTDEEKKRLINELEDRTLLRSLESYGRDCTLLRSKIVPVFGSTRKRSVDQIRNRWQQLMMRKKKSEVYKSWTATEIAAAPSLRETTNDGGVPSSLSRDADENVRRSRRAVKPRAVDF